MFRWTFILVFCALSLLRLYFRVTAGLFREPPYSRQEPLRFILARAMLGLPLVAGTVVYCFLPGVWPWAYLPLPAWLRVAGAALCVAALALLLAVHRALGGTFTSSPAPRPAAPLVRHGPYAWVRHPMYAAYLVLFSGGFLLSASWLIGASGLAVIVLLLTWRRRHEEARLSARYGQAYERYCASTGALLPRRRASTPRSSSPG